MEVPTTPLAPPPPIPLPISILSTYRIHPSTPPMPLPQNQQQSPSPSPTPNSLNLPPQVAVWFFPAPPFPPPNHPHSPPFSPSLLHFSLRKTLSLYPHFAGRITFIPPPTHPQTFTPPPSSPPHTLRPWRLFVTYNSPPTDAGIIFTLASSPTHLSALIPSPAARAALPRGWDASALDLGLFVPEEELVCGGNMSEEDFKGRAGMAVQVTRLGCGGLAVGVKMAHCLADAVAMVAFMKDWGVVHRSVVSALPFDAEPRTGAVDAFPPSLLGGREPNSAWDLQLLIAMPPAPLFAPHLLSLAASGTIDAPSPSPSLVAHAHSLPQHRYDWWASLTPSCPPFMRAQCTPPAGFEGVEKGDVLPWAQWDWRAETRHVVLHFGAGEVERIWEGVSGGGRGGARGEEKGEGVKGEGKNEKGRISRQDALLAFLWLLINRARGLSGSSDLVYMTISLGLRTRLSPPLPSTFLGSPIIHARVSLPSRLSTAPENLRAIAQEIRGTAEKFDEEAIGALLHDMAFETAAGRTWNAFLGRRDLIVTSWVRAGIYDVRFGEGGAWWVGVVLPGMGGIVQVMEGAGGGGGREGETGTEEVGKIGEGRERHWCADGVDVDLNLGREAMERLVGDGLLRRFAGG